MSATSPSIESARREGGYGLPPQPQVAIPRAAPARGSRWARWRGDIAGGGTAAAITIPVGIGYGMLAFAPLGDAFVAHGVVAGLYAVLCGGIVALLLGANTTMIYAPRSVATFLIGALAAQNIMTGHAATLARLPPGSAMVLLLGMVAAAGAIQALLGLLRVGTLVRYVPSTVTAGFQNAAAVLIFASQIHAMLGLPRGGAALDLAAHANEIRPLAVLLAAVVIATTLSAARFSHRLPPTLLGLLAGLAAWHGLAAAGLSDHAGPVIGALPATVPGGGYVTSFAELLRDPGVRAMLPALAGAALSLALVASLDAMLCAKIVETDSGRRFDGNRELVRIGVGNCLSGCVGGIANGINLSSSFANHRSGATTPASVLVHGIVVAVVVLLLSPLIAAMPRAVLAGMLATVAIQLVDRWTLSIVWRLLRGEVSHWQRMLLDLTVILSVAATAVAFDIVVAVTLGMALAVVFFLLRVSKSVVRRAYRADVLRSRKARTATLSGILVEHGHRILVLELEGPIFFGTGEILANRVEAELARDTDTVILDLRRTSDLDTTGARILLQCHDRFERHGRVLVLSGVEGGSRIARMLRESGVLAGFGADRLFDDTDHALEWAEDRLLIAVTGEPESPGEFPFESLEVVRRMDATQVAVLRGLLVEAKFETGEVVFREHEEGAELFIVTRGTASAHIRIDDGRTARLFTFTPGTLFGELALLDRDVRSATVIADSPLTCQVLTRDAFDRLMRDHTLVAIKLLANIGRELSGRLRHANRTIHQLDA